MCVLDDCDRRKFEKKKKAGGGNKAIQQGSRKAEGSLRNKANQKTSIHKKRTHLQHPVNNQWPHQKQIQGQQNNNQMSSPRTNKVHLNTQTSPTQLKAPSNLPTTTPQGGIWPPEI